MSLSSYSLESYTWHTQDCSAVRSMCICTISIKFFKAHAGVCVCTCAKQSPCSGAALDGIKRSKMVQRGHAHMSFSVSIAHGRGRQSSQNASHCSFWTPADHMIFGWLQYRLIVGDKENIHCYWFGSHSENADLWISRYQGPN